MTVIEDERASRVSDVERALLDRVVALIGDEGLPDEVYVTSFSAHGDLLSQWRGYGSADGRFSLGFQLSQFSERDVLQLPRPVEYEAARQREQVRRAIEVACGTAADADDNPQNAWSCATSLTFHLRRIMCLFKHAGFSEEQEWRSVTTMSPMDDLRGITFEAVRGVPRPYIVMLAGSRTSTRLPVIEVCVGHTERKTATYRAAQLLLARYGYRNAKVTETQTPFSG